MILLSRGLIDSLRAAPWGLRLAIIGAAALTAASVSGGAAYLALGGGGDGKDEVNQRTVSPSPPPTPTTAPRNDAADAEEAVRKFYERLAKFDTAGMIDLSCPDAVADVETAVSLLQGIFGFGAAFGGIDAPAMTIEDYESDMVSAGADEAVVHVAFRLNAGAPYGSTSLDEQVTLHRDGGRWCIAGEGIDEEPPSGTSAWKVYVLSSQRLPTVFEGTGYEKQAESGWDFLVVDLAAENVGTSWEPFPSDAWENATIQSSAGFSYPVSEQNRYWFTVAGTQLVPLTSGLRQKLELIFDVPLNQNGFTITMPGVGAIDPSTTTNQVFPLDPGQQSQLPAVFQRTGEWQLSIGTQVSTPSSVSPTRFQDLSSDLVAEPGFKLAQVGVNLENLGGYELVLQHKGFFAYVVDSRGLSAFEIQDPAYESCYFGGFQAVDVAPGQTYTCYLYWQVPASDTQLAIVITSEQLDQPKELIGTVVLKLP